MFEVHSLSDLSQTKLRMECAPVQTESSLTIKPGLGLLVLYWSVIVSNLSGGEGKSLCHCWCVWKLGVVQGHQSVPSPSILPGTWRISCRTWRTCVWEDTPYLPLLAEGLALVMVLGVLSKGCRWGCGVDAESSGGNKCLGQEEIKTKAINVGKAGRNVFWRGYWKDLRDSLDPKILRKEQVCFSFP